MELNTSPAMTILGVDVGGTFTDFMLIERSSEGVSLRVYKRPSTPSAPAEAILKGIEEMGVRPESVVHGSTVATNAVLERKGAVTALITSEGCRDILAIGRQARPGLYELTPSRPPVLVPDRLRFEVPERIDYLGNTLVPLDPESADTVLDRLADIGVESVAICFLFSFLKPEHEQYVADAARKRSFYVTASNEVLPEYREYERTSTTTLNAYVGPVMSRYLEALSDGLVDRGVQNLRIIQSDGGSASAVSVSRLAVRTLLSGPAGGVRGAFAVAGLSGFTNIITFDMGGTSTDVSICPERILERPDAVIGDMPVRTPVIDIHTVGAGGGSIVRIDAGGALRVGPESAGADPGPACYGRGEQPTVTDAQLLLGRLVPDHFLGGRALLDESRSKLAFAPIAERYGGDVMRAAQAVVAVANSNMVRGVRVVSVERGYDPRQFSLVAFGGAGPLHACDLAELLQIPRVIVPAFPGVLSAFGMASADVTKSYSKSLITTITHENQQSLAESLLNAYRDLSNAALDEMVLDGISAEAVRYERAIDLRYAGQSYEITVPIDGIDLAEIASRFHRAHRERYGHGDASRQVELVTVRLKAIVAAEPVVPPRLPVGTEDPDEARIGSRQVWFNGMTAASVFDRSLLKARNEIVGPAIVVQMDSTCVVPPAWRCRVDEWGNLVLERA